jgi:tetratricopeptide (TPR) repeat protein
VVFVWTYNAYLLAWPVQLCNDYSAESMVPLLVPTAASPQGLLTALPTDIKHAAECVCSALYILYQALSLMVFSVLPEEQREKLQNYTRSSALHHGLQELLPPPGNNRSDRSRWGEPDDPRLWAVALFYVTAMLVVWKVLTSKFNSGNGDRVDKAVDKSVDKKDSEEERKKGQQQPEDEGEARPLELELLACLLFLVVPFILSSNLLFPVGFVVAERVLYIPSSGYCMLVGVLVRQIYGGTSSTAQDPAAAAAHTHPKMFLAHLAELIRRVGLVLVVAVVLYAYGDQTLTRHREWATGYTLWNSAHKVNPQSAHVLHNYALELSWKGRQKEAAKSFKKALRLRPDDLSTRFGLARAQRRQDRCDQAQKVAMKGLKIIRE